jgi:hypothetical protein
VVCICCSLRVQASAVTAASICRSSRTPAYHSRTLPRVRAASRSRSAPFRALTRLRSRPRRAGPCLLQPCLGSATVRASVSSIFRRGDELRDLRGGCERADGLHTLAVRRRRAGGQPRVRQDTAILPPLFPRAEAGEVHQVVVDGAPPSRSEC